MRYLVYSHNFNLFLLIVLSTILITATCLPPTVAARTIQERIEELVPTGCEMDGRSGRMLVRLEQKKGSSLRRISRSQKRLASYKTKLLDLNNSSDSENERTIIRLKKRVARLEARISKRLRKIDDISSRMGSLLNDMECHKIIPDKIPTPVPTLDPILTPTFIPTIFISPSPTIIPTDVAPTVIPDPTSTPRVTPTREILPLPVPIPKPTQRPVAKDRSDAYKEYLGSISMIPKFPNTTSNERIKDIFSNPANIVTVDTIDQLNDALVNVMPGTKIVVMPGDYKGDLIISRGGSFDSPVIITGLSSSSEWPVFSGSRPKKYEDSSATGGAGIILRSGSDNIVIRNLKLNNYGDGGAISFDGVGNNVVIENIEFNNNRRVINHYQGELSNVIIRRIKAVGYSKQFIRLGTENTGGPEVKQILLEEIYGDSAGQDNDKFCMGVILRGKTHDVTVQDVSMLNCRQFVDSGYANGDGFVSESDTYNLLFIDTFASGHTDGGYDLKGSNITMIRPHAVDNKRNFRFWANKVKVFEPIGLNPHKRAKNGCCSQTQVWLSDSAEVNFFGGEIIEDASSPYKNQTKVIEGKNLSIQTWKGYALIEYFNELGNIQLDSDIEVCNGGCSKKRKLSS